MSSHYEDMKDKIQNFLENGPPKTTFELSKEQQRIMWIIWEEIAQDAGDLSTNGILDQTEVIELVLDAGRLEMCGDPGRWVEFRKLPYQEQIEVSKQVFKYDTYEVGS
jgi:hypothetical protein